MGVAPHSRRNRGSRCRIEMRSNGLGQVFVSRGGRTFRQVATPGKHRRYEYREIDYQTPQRKPPPTAPTYKPPTRPTPKPTVTPTPKPKPPEPEPIPPESYIPVPYVPPPPPVKVEDAYDIFVNGKKVGTVKSLSEATQIAYSRTKSGDTFEIFRNGQSLGLRVRAGATPVTVPREVEPVVRSAPPVAVKTAVEEAERRVKNGTAKRENGFPWGLILVLGGVGAAAVASQS